VSTSILRLSPLFALICFAAGIIAFFSGGFVIGSAMVAIAASFVLIGRGKIAWEELPMWRKNGSIGLQVVAVILIFASLFYTGGK